MTAESNSLHVKKWRKANREKYNKCIANWRKNNPKRAREQTKKAVKKHKDNNPEYMRKVMAKRNRELGFNSLNEKFEGSVAHHINKNDVIYIPEELHKSISHSQNNQISMEAMNQLALEYL